MGTTLELGIKSSGLLGACGGCSLPGVPYDKQLACERRRLAELLGMDVPPLIASPRESAFRQKAAFVFASGGAVSAS